MLTVFLADCILFFQAEDGIRDGHVTGVQTCALPIWADGDDALALVAAGEIDVLLLDLRMPRRDGIAVLEAMRERGRSEERRVGEEGRYDERREREEGEQEAESEHEDTA